MEQELNYISEKIEDVQHDVDYYEREMKCCESPVDIIDISDLFERRNSELEMLNNILNFITQNV